MKLNKTASGKTSVTITRQDWEKIGQQNGWTKAAAAEDMPGTARPLKQELLEKMNAGLAEFLKAHPELRLPYAVFEVSDGQLRLLTYNHEKSRVETAIPSADLSAELPPGPKNRPQTRDIEPG